MSHFALLMAELAMKEGERAGQPARTTLGSLHALAIGKRNDFRQLPRDFIHVLRAQLALLLMLLLTELPHVLLRLSVGGLPLPARTLLAETALLPETALAVALRLLQQLGKDRQDLAHDLIDVLL
jgi:hypothetical protein